jgi:hypothetical protein
LEKKRLSNTIRRDKNCKMLREQVDLEPAEEFLTVRKHSAE